MGPEKKFDKRFGTTKKLIGVRGGVMTAVGNKEPERKETRQITEEEISFIPCPSKTVAIFPWQLSLALSKIALNKRLSVADVCRKAAFELGAIKSPDARAVKATIDYSGSVQGVAAEYHSFSEIYILPGQEIPLVKIVIPDMCFTICRDSLRVIK